MNMAKGLEEQKAAVESGHYPLFRFDPRRADKGENPLMIDSKPPSIPFEQYTSTQNRFNMLKKMQPERARMLLNMAQKQ